MVFGIKGFVVVVAAVLLWYTDTGAECYSSLLSINITILYCFWFLLENEYTNSVYKDIYLLIHAAISAISGIVFHIKIKAVVWKWVGFKLSQVVR
jgi:hypothetical protein